MTVKTMRKIILEDCKRGATGKSELDYEIVEKVIAENYVHNISIQELVCAIAHIADGGHAMLIVEVLGIVRTPVVIYEGNFQAVISLRETEDGVQETFILVSHGDEISNLEFDALAVKEIIWDKWSGYFLIKFIENIEIMISY